MADDQPVGHLEPLLLTLLIVRDAWALRQAATTTT
jgi:hypothetical protein